MSSQAFFTIDNILLFGHLMLAAAAVAGFARLKRLPANLRYLLALVGLEGITEIIVGIMQHRHQPNLFIFPIFSAGEFWLLSLIYGKTLHSPAFSRVRPWLAATFVCYCAIDSLLSPEVAHFKPVLQLIESMLVLTLVGLFFRKLLRELRVTNLGQEPIFWVSVGLVIYHLGNVQIYLFSNFLLSHYSNQLNLNIWDIHALLLVVLYSCYLVALWIRPQN